MNQRITKFLQRFDLEEMIPKFLEWENKKSTYSNIFMEVVKYFEEYGTRLYCHEDFFSYYEVEVGAYILRKYYHATPVWYEIEKDNQIIFPTDE